VLLPAASGARRSVLEFYSFISGNSSYSGSFEVQVQFYKNSRLAIRARGMAVTPILQHSQAVI
jgi:hypothetical protein